MIISTDQHHMGDLEKKIVEAFCNDHEIRCIGDLSVHQQLASDISLCKEIQNRYKKENGMLNDTEISFQDKCKLVEKAIKPYEYEEFTKWKVYYGATPIYNLARKAFISDRIMKSKKKEAGFIGLMSHEKLLSTIQGIIAEKMKIKNRKYIPKILRCIEKECKGMMQLTYNLLKEAGVEDPKSYVLETLNIQNFKGEIPTGEKVFAEYPRKNYFNFKRDLYWERIENMMIIYVPLFENNNECTRALEHRQSIINDYKSWNPKSVIIASHMNPHPTVMGNRQIDHNIGLIIPLTDEVCEITGKETRIFCGHLHKSAKPYEWNLASKKGAIIYPLDVDELYIINTNKTFEEPILKKIN